MPPVMTLLLRHVMLSHECRCLTLESTRHRGTLVDRSSAIRASSRNLSGEHQTSLGTFLATQERSSIAIPLDFQPKRVQFGE